LHVDPGGQHIVPHGSCPDGHCRQAPFLQIWFAEQHSLPHSTVPLAQTQRLIAHSLPGGQQSSPHASRPDGHFLQTPFWQSLNPGGQQISPHEICPVGHLQCGKPPPGNGLQIIPFGQHSRPQGRCPFGQRRHFGGELWRKSQISFSLQHLSQHFSRVQHFGLGTEPYPQQSSSASGSQQSSPHVCACGHLHFFVCASQICPGGQHLSPHRNRPPVHFFRHLLPGR
jgi:hypothetical protein